MVRVKAPLMSLDASGTVGKSIVFSSWKGRSYVRRHAIPSNPKSGLQVGIRSVFGFLTQHFAYLTPAELAIWKAQAEAKNLTPLNALIADGVERARRNLGWRSDPSDEDPVEVNPPTDLLATPQPGTAVLTWTPGAFPSATFCWAVYSSTLDIFTPDISNLVGVVPYLQTQITLRGLQAGTTYYFIVRGLSTNGSLSTNSNTADTEIL